MEAGTHFFFKVSFLAFSLPQQALELKVPQARLSSYFLPLQSSRVFLKPAEPLGLSEKGGDERLAPFRNTHWTNYLAFLGLHGRAVARNFAAAMARNEGDSVSYWKSAKKKLLNVVNNFHSKKLKVNRACQAPTSLQASFFLRNWVESGLHVIFPYVSPNAQVRDVF